MIGKVLSHGGGREPSDLCKLEGTTYRGLPVLAFWLNGMIRAKNGEHVKTGEVAVR